MRSVEQDSDLKNHAALGCSPRADDAWAWRAGGAGNRHPFAGCCINARGQLGRVLAGEHGIGSRCGACPLQIDREFNRGLSLAPSRLNGQGLASLNHHNLLLKAAHGARALTLGPISRITRSAEPCRHPLKGNRLLQGKHSAPTIANPDLLRRDPRLVRAVGGVRDDLIRRHLNLPQFDRQVDSRSACRFA